MVRSWAAAWAASSARVAMPSLAKIWDKCTLTVPRAMNSRDHAAMLLLPPSQAAALGGRERKVVALIAGGSPAPGSRSGSCSVR